MNLQLCCHWCGASGRSHKLAVRKCGLIWTHYYTVASLSVFEHTAFTECVEGIYIKFFLILQLHRICMIFAMLLTLAGVVIIFAFLHWEFKVQFYNFFVFSNPSATAFMYRF